MEEFEGVTSYELFIMGAINFLRVNSNLIPQIY